MATSVSTTTITPQHSAIPASLLNACFVLFVINASFFPAAYRHVYLHGSAGWSRRHADRRGPDLASRQSLVPAGFPVVLTNTHA
jgi:hypothetical protein